MDPAREFPQIIRGFNYLRLGEVDSLEAAIRRIPLGLDPLGHDDVRPLDGPQYQAPSCPSAGVPG